MGTRGHTHHPQPRRGCRPGSDGCTPPRRPKDATPEAGCRRDLAVGERQRNPRKTSLKKAMHPYRMRILQPCWWFVIRVLCGRRMVWDDGYPGLRFAYPGLYASPASRPHMLRMSSPQHRCRCNHDNDVMMVVCRHDVWRGVLHTPGISTKTVVEMDVRRT